MCAAIRARNLSRVNTGTDPYQGNRKHERIETALPVDLGHASGVIRNVSSSGIYFETDASLALGANIRFKVALDTAGGKLILNCRGNIVRIEPHDNTMGVAVQVMESMLERMTGCGDRQLEQEHL